MKRRERPRLRLALLASALLHAGVGALIWATASRAAELPRMRVYAIDLVSPPPQVAGERDPGSAAPEATPDEAPPEESSPEPEPVAETPPPPAEKPRPEPPRPEPKPAEPRKEQSTPPRATTPPKTEAKPEAKKPEPKPEPKKPEAQPPKTAEKPGEGKPRPAAGDRPDPASRGGEDLNVQQEGAEFVDPEYLANITRQLRRRFRPPPGARSDAVEVFFRINRDGSVADIRVVRQSGGMRFRLAALEAVEQAGLDRAFGPLPRAYPADQLAVSFYFDPAN